MVASLGRKEWSVERDEEGYRSYTLVSYVETDSVEDGPLIVLNCPGLPLPGSWWQQGDEYDSWVWCRPSAKVKQLNSGEPGKHWSVTQEFSNKPLPDKLQRCSNTKIEDPLLEPQKISGSFCKYTEEATIDRFGLPIVNSAWEQIRGPQAEFDAGRGTVIIEQNVADLQLDVCAAFYNCVNDDVLWGLPRRCVKLSDFNWSRRFYGQCFPYYTRRFQFDFLVKKDPATGAIVSGFDRDNLDEGTKCLKGRYDSTVKGGGDYILDKIAGVFYPDPFNPSHFDVHRGRDGNPCKVVLNGLGLPSGVVVRAGPSKYMSIVAFHTDNDVGDTDRWIRLTNDPVNRPKWTAGSWPQGALVNFLAGGGGSSIYLCTAKKGTRLTPGGADWLFLASIADKGAYATTTSYAVGDYADVEADVGPYYFSLVNAAQHTAGDLFTDTRWVRLVSSPTKPPLWNRQDVYPRGSLVNYQNGSSKGIYVQTARAAAGQGLFGADEPATNDPKAKWRFVPSPAPTAKGAWDGTANYNYGDYVSPSTTVPGKIHVEKYNEAPFLLLGIPTVLV